MLVKGLEILEDYPGMKAADLLSWVMAELTPFEKFDGYPMQCFKDLKSPRGYRRVFPPRAIDAGSTYDDLCHRLYPKYESLRAENRNENQELEFNKLCDKLDQIEAYLSKIWKDPEAAVPPQAVPLQYGEIINLLKNSYFRSEDVKRILSLDKNGSAKKDDSAVRLEISTQNEEKKPAKKRNYKTEQSEKAIAIAQKLRNDNDMITLEEIKANPDIQACFREGTMPGDSEFRRLLNKGNIKLKPGNRPTKK